jgi:hypothetical protein
MTPKQAWKTLGIDATSDKRAIKRAYAGKLKSIDPDKDPKTFLALRDALQAATWDAAYVDDDDYQTWGEDETAEEHQERREMEVLGYSPSTEEESVGSGIHIIDPIRDDELEPDSDHEPFDDIDPQEWDEEVDPDYDENAPRNRMSTILWGDDDIVLLEDELRSITNGLIDSLEDETIDVAGETENWLGWIVSATMRRSDCLIPIIVKRFDWKAKAGSVNAPYYMDDVIARYRDLVRITALRKPGHPDHETYLRLCKPSQGALGRGEVFMHRGKVKAFVARIRADNPTIEWDFNPETLADWETHVSALADREANTGEKSSWGSWRLGFFALLFLSQLLRACPDSSNKIDGPFVPPPVSGLGQYDGLPALEVDKADPTKVEGDVSCLKDPVTQSVSCVPQASTLPPGLKPNTPSNFPPRAPLPPPPLPEPSLR